MKRAILVLAICVLAILGITQVQAQGDLTLESLATSIEALVGKDKELEARIVDLENQFGVVTATPTATSTPTSTHTPTPSPTFAPTPLLPATSFEEVLSEYAKNKTRFKCRFVGRNVYIEGRIDRLTEHDEGWQLEFKEGDKLDLTCQLPASARPTVIALSVGDDVIVYGHTILDENRFSDDDLLIKQCQVAPASRGRSQTQGSRATPIPQSPQSDQDC